MVGSVKERLNRRFLISPYGFHPAPWAGRAPRRATKTRCTALPSDPLGFHLAHHSALPPCSTVASPSTFFVPGIVCYTYLGVQRRVIILTSLKSSSSSSALPGSGVMRNTSREVTAAAATISPPLPPPVALLLLLLLFLPRHLRPPHCFARSLLSSSLLSVPPAPPAGIAQPLLEQSFITALTIIRAACPRQQKPRSIEVAD